MRQVLVWLLRVPALGFPLQQKWLEGPRRWPGSLLKPDSSMRQVPVIIHTWAQVSCIEGKGVVNYFSKRPLTPPAVGPTALRAPEGRRAGWGSCFHPSLKAGEMGQVFLCGLAVPPRSPAARDPSTRSGTGSGAHGARGDGWGVNVRALRGQRPLIANNAMNGAQLSHHCEVLMTGPPATNIEGYLSELSSY